MKPVFWQLLAIILTTTHPFAAHAQRTQRISGTLTFSWLQMAALILAVLAVAVTLAWMTRKIQAQQIEIQKKQTEREQANTIAEMRGLLSAARHELTTAFSQYREGPGTVFNLAEPSGMLTEPIILTAESYVIYPYFLSQIGKLKDVRIGKDVLNAYAMHKRFRESVNWYNTLLQWYDKQSSGSVNSQAEPVQPALSDLREKLVEQKRKMQTAYTEMEAATEAVSAFINEDGTLSPRIKQGLHSKYYFLNSPHDAVFK